MRFDAVRIPLRPECLQAWPLTNDYAISLRTLVATRRREAQQVVKPQIRMFGPG